MNIEVMSLRMMAMLLALLMCCASGAPRWNPDKVLDDVLVHGYRFSGAQRKTAIEDIASRDGVRSTAMLIQVAEMKRSLEPSHELADLMAIEAALIALTDMHDGRAVELNRQRLDDDSIRGIALINLTVLKGWDATGDVEAWFANAPLRAEQMYVISEAAKFLSLSPRSTSASCIGIERIRRNFPECFGNTAAYRCVDLNDSLIDLGRHLRCADAR